MSSTKTPTSSLSVIELLAMRVWYRSIAGIRKLCPGRASPKAAATHSSPANRLPQEIVEMIIAHLIYDKYNLFACSLTRYSWYIAAVPHLHHTLTTVISPHWRTKKAVWPMPLPHLHRLGLLPLVKKLRIRQGLSWHGWFSPARLDLFPLPRFLTLTNVQEFEIESLDISAFIPEARRYFRYFLPTLRSLTLREPTGCHYQILFFIGLFQHLEDLKLFFRRNRRFGREHTHNPILIPPSTPPLRGSLTMRFVKGAMFSKDMIRLFAGIPFCRMDLYYVDGMSLLLDACAEKLETLRLHLNDPCFEKSLQGFGLSRNRSLRTLEVTAISIYRLSQDFSPDPASSLLKRTLSTITSPAFLEVIVFYRYYEFHGLQSPRLRFGQGGSAWNPVRDVSQGHRAEEASRHHKEFSAFSEAQKVRDFRFVLCADVWDRVVEYSVQALKTAVAVEKAKGMFDSFSSEPMVIHSSRAAPAGEGEDLYARSITVPWELL